MVGDGDHIKLYEFAWYSIRIKMGYGLIYMLIFNTLNIFPQLVVQISIPKCDDIIDHLSGRSESIVFDLDNA
jgi:hypothetical protein